jgi:hypothetical protein
MGLVTQQDPIGIAGGLNLYGYADGDPVNFSDPFGLRAAECPGILTNEGEETEAPCELFAVVFSEAAPREAAQALGIAYTAVNRARDSSHNYSGVPANSGDFFADVTAHVLGPDYQGNQNAQFAGAMQFIQSGSGLDALQLAQFGIVVGQAEAAFTGALGDPTGGATFFDHSSVPGAGASQRFCGPVATVSIGTANFARCSR